MVTDLSITNKIFEIFEQGNPIPKIELNYTNNFTLLVAVILSAQHTDVGVNKATKALFAICDTPEKILALGIERLQYHIRTIGLNHTKAKNIIATSKILIEQYQSQVPSNFESLLSLPGVGRKTANVVQNTCFNIPTIPVDTHVFRVSRRIGFSSSDTVGKVEHDLLNHIPHEWIVKGAHHWLVLHGRYVCKARNPDCQNCKISALCQKIGI